MFTCFALRRRVIKRCSEDLEGTFKNGRSKPAAGIRRMRRIKHHQSLRMNHIHLIPRSGFFVGERTMRVAEREPEVKSSEKWGSPWLGHNSRVGGRDRTTQGETRSFNALSHKRCRMWHRRAEENGAASSYGEFSGKFSYWLSLRPCGSQQMTIPQPGHCG
jgi:hypothetical protein